MHPHERTRTTPSPYRTRGRAVEAMACTILRRQGYSVIRTMRYSSVIHLVAWCDRDHRILFVHIKRTRQEIAGSADVLSLWQEDVRSLREIPRWEGIAVQLWVHAGPRGWRFFEVYPCGIAEVDVDVA